MMKLNGKTHSDNERNRYKIFNVHKQKRHHIDRFGTTHNSINILGFGFYPFLIRLFSHKWNRKGFGETKEKKNVNQPYDAQTFKFNPMGALYLLI